MGKKVYGIFLNTAKANCSIHESGKMIYGSLFSSNKYGLDYLEIDEDSHQISSKYDFYIFNYHPLTMGWLNTKAISRLPGVKITFILEMLPNNPFVLCPQDFDAYCVLDPTMNVNNKKVYTFSRPLEVANHLSDYQEQPIPIIGSFGFATPGKGFELVVDAVNKEFESAIVKINIPSGKYTDAFFWDLHKRDYADYLEELCKKVAKKGTQIQITHDYMSKDQLIKWCNQNTLNCFLYHRDQPGLAATTDQAISSSRPLAISSNETFRHIHPYIRPYPFQSLKESIMSSQPQVLRMREAWSPKNFTDKFEKVLQDFNLFSEKKNSFSHNHMINLPKRKILPILNFLKKILPTDIRNHISRYMRQRARTSKQVLKGDADNPRKNILIVSGKKKRCGIGQYGLNIAEALQKSSKYSFLYTECSNPEELKKAMATFNPVVVIYNYYPATMPWLNSKITRQFRASQLGIMHEVTQEEANKATQEMFDFHVCPDPTLVENNPHVFKTGRLILPYVNTQNIPAITTIGSFGFDFNDMGFDRLVNTVQQEFDEAKIILHLPVNDIIDKQGYYALSTAHRCRKIIKKPKIKLIINHEFLDKFALVDFLAGNTINAFFYDTEKNRGISSVIDYALAVQRPIAITKCGMFRHIIPASPSICIEDTNMTQIINNGVVPLIPFYNQWSEANFILNHENIIDHLLNNNVVSLNQKLF